MRRRIFTKLLTCFCILASSQQALASKASAHLAFCYAPWLGAKNVELGPGPDVELANHWLHTLGRKLNSVQVKWNELFENSDGKVIESEAYTPRLLRSSTCSFYASSMSQTSWRTSKLKIVPIYPGRIMVITRADRKEIIRSYSDLAGKRTVVVPQTTFHDWMKQVLLTDFKNNPFNIRLLPQGGTIDYILDGSVDFALFDTAQAFHLLKQHGNKLRIAFAAGPIQYVGWGFALSDEQLPALFEKYIADQKRNPASPMNQIYRKYFGVSVAEFDSIVLFSNPTGNSRQ